MPETLGIKTSLKSNSHHFTFRGNAEILQEDTASELLLAGAAGTGKSVACLWKLHKLCEKNENIRCLIVRKTRESLTQSAMVTFERQVLPLVHQIKFRVREQEYRYPNGSVIVIGGLDKPSKIMSTEFDVIYVQEATEVKLEDWQALTTRLRNGKLPFQQIIADCNPDAPNHWLKIRCDQEKCKLLPTTHEDNPRFYNLEKQEWTEEGKRYISKLDALTGAEYERLRWGKWVQASGIVYDTWSEQKNVADEAEYREGYGRILWAVDDGYAGEIDPSTGYPSAQSHPRVFLFVQQRPDGTLCIFDESVKTKTLQNLHIEEILNYPTPDLVVVDRSAAALKGELYEKGFDVRSISEGVEEGIKRLREWIGPDENEKRKILVHPRCKYLRQEILSYRYDSNGKPVKEFDHSLDALRYLVTLLSKGH